MNMNKFKFVSFIQFYSLHTTARKWQPQNVVGFPCDVEMVYQFISLLLITILNLCWVIIICAKIGVSLTNRFGNQPECLLSSSCSQWASQPQCPSFEFAGFQPLLNDVVMVECMLVIPGIDFSIWI